MATYNGKETRDVINGTSGADTINGNGGDDHLLGQGGNDTINGGIGNDKLDGGAGNDILSGGVGVDFLGGGTGNDFMYGGDGDDYLYDLSGTNTLRGEIGNDRLVSNKHGRLDGGVGDDVLVAEIGGPFSGVGSGHYVGGEGADTLRVNNMVGTAQPSDFVYIDVEGVGAGGLYGSAGKQTDVDNSDTWETLHQFNFDGMSRFEVTSGSSLYFEGHMATGSGPKTSYSIQASDRFDFLQLGSENETVTTGTGGDSIYVTGGFHSEPGTVIDYGTDHITDFSKDDGDLLLLGWGGEGTRVEIEETATQTFVRSYFDGQEAPANTVVLNAVGVQDSIWMDWQTV